MALHLNHQMMMLHHFKLTLKHEKNIEKAFIQVIPLLPKIFQKKLHHISMDLKQGHKIDHVLIKYKKIFHPLVIQTLSLLNNHLYYDVIIEQTIKHVVLVQKSKELKRKSTRYPMILSFFIFIVFLGFVLFLLPFIKQMYVNFNVEPSGLMRTIETMRIWIYTYFPIIMFILACVMIGFTFLYMNQTIRREMFMFMYKKLRLFKRFHLAFLTRLFTYMQLMLLEKKPIFDVFIELEKRFKYTVFERDLKTLIIQLEEGQSLSEMIKISPIFNSVISNLFQHAQSNEQIQEITTVLSQYYYEELVMRNHQFYAMLEPILISILSVFVGLIAFMIYEPLLSIYEGL